MIIFLIAALFSSVTFGKTGVHTQSIELLGAKKAKTIALKPKNVKAHITSILEKRLPKAYRAEAKLIAGTIVANANKYNLDPMFVTAVIAGESSFNPKAHGPVGEIGMMQLREETAKWITKEYLKKKWQGKKVLYNPYENIRIGTSYLRFLRSRFKKSSHYLAAYNLGPSQLKQALSRKVEPKDYAKHVMKRYITLHQGK